MKPKGGVTLPPKLAAETLRHLLKHAQEVVDARVEEGPHVSQQATVLSEGRRRSSAQDHSQCAPAGARSRMAAEEGDHDTRSISTYSRVAQQGSVEADVEEEESADGHVGVDQEGTEGAEDCSQGSPCLGLDFSFGMRAAATGGSKGDVCDGAGSPEGASPLNWGTGPGSRRVSGSLQPTPAPRPPPSLAPRATPPSLLPMAVSEPQPGDVCLRATTRDSFASPTGARQSADDVEGNCDQGAGMAAAPMAAAAASQLGAAGLLQSPVLGVSGARMRMLRHCGRAAAAEAMQRAAADSGASESYGDPEAGAAAHVQGGGADEQLGQPAAGCCGDMQRLGGDGMCAAGNAWVVDARPQEPIVSRVMAGPPR